ncbi:HAD family hydrolase [Paenibacillus thailandensis]|uniref:HAD family hydrolase n=1 Tax=Paenibacillus thailandensis TaxID=393250 RepID=A0ABW5QR88_9BACL
MIKAIVFDFDGTILDTETPWFEAFREAYRARGAELSLETFSACIGTSLDAFNPYEFINTLIEKPVEPESFKKEIRDRHAALMKQVRMQPGIQAYLDAAKQAGLKIGLASSSSRAWIDKHVNLLGIAHYFDCIRTSDDVNKVKPDPELYRQALEALNVSPQEAVAIEDSPNGSRAAVAAGMHCVVVPTPVTRSLAFDPACLMADCLTDVEFERLVADPLALAK